MSFNGASVGLDVHALSVVAHAVDEETVRIERARLCPATARFWAGCVGSAGRVLETLPPTASATLERVITDNHLSYRRSHDFAATVADLGAKQIFIRPHCPAQNGKVER